MGRLGGDEVPDVVVGYSVLGGLPDGGLAAPAVAPGGTRGKQLVLARLDADALLDLIVTNIDGAVDVFLGTGQGGLTPKGHYPFSRANGLAVADFDADGDLDFAVGNYNAAALVHVYLGNGDGTFAFSQAYSPGGDWPAALVAGNHDLDDTVDLLVVNYLSEDTFLMTGRGDGTFTVTASRIVLGSRGNNAAGVDLDLDGRLDVAVPDYEGSLHVLLGRPSGAFGNGGVFKTTGSWSEGVAQGDFNRDGKPDLVVANPSEDNVSVFLNTSFPEP